MPIYSRNEVSMNAVSTHRFQVQAWIRNSRTCHLAFIDISDLIVYFEFTYSRISICALSSYVLGSSDSK